MFEKNKLKVISIAFVIALQFLGNSSAEPNPNMPMTLTELEALKSSDENIFFAFQEQGGKYFVAKNIIDPMREWAGDGRLGELLGTFVNNCNIDGGVQDFIKDLESSEGFSGFQSKQFSVPTTKGEVPFNYLSTQGEVSGEVCGFPISDMKVFAVTTKNLKSSYNLSEADDTALNSLVE